MIRSDKSNLLSFYTFIGISVIILLVHLLVPYNLSSFPSSLIYPVILISGIWFMRKSLRFYFSDQIVAFTLVLFAFATNLFFAGVLGTLIQPLLLFAFYAAFIFLIISWHQKPSIPTVTFLGIITGLIILFHPTGYFVFLLPILWNKHNKTSWKEKKVLVRKNWLHSLIFIALVILTNIVAFYAWNAKPGEIPSLNLKLPGVFTIGSRFLWNDLFSFDHGWLIYSPMLILPAFGFYFLAERKRLLFFALFLFCTLDIIAESCWTKLDYSMIFGQIAFLQLYPLLVFPAAELIAWIMQKRRILQASFFSIFVLLIAINLVQTCQYKEGVIPSSGMTAEIYGIVFGRTNLTNHEKWRISEITGEEVNLFRDDCKLKLRNLASYDFEHPNPANLSSYVSEQVKYGHFAFKMDSNMRFTPGIDIYYQELTKQSRAKVRISAAVYCKEILKKKSLFLVITSEHDQKNYHYRMFDVMETGVVPGQWKTVALDYLIPVNPQHEDRLKGYVFYSGNQTILVDNVNIYLFEQKE